ncbi:hypothetical protein [Streptomyces sp. 8N706]|uniref:hypothetical protein n=1 Tax=Streptomyces sp. 8N706 TaxID=3457416 RepID=UPI003FD08748
MNTRTTTAIVSLAAALLLTACSGLTHPATPDAEAAPEETVAATASSSPSPSPAAGFKVGEEARNGGAVVKISRIHEVDGITMDGGTKRAGAEEKYVGLEVVVFNDTKASMDLTCSLPIANSLIDDQGRRYDAIGDLYEIPGNPECNEQLRPGSKDEMVFAYRVPKGATITAWEFSESGLESDREPTTIHLSGPSPT